MSDAPLSSPRPPGGEFWEYVDWLVRGSRVVIDRPKGTPHPHYPSLIYPLDYGYLEGTMAIDGGGVDVWVGSGSPAEVEALAITVDLAKRDAEVKILIGCRQAEIDLVMDFLNGERMRAVLVERHPRGHDLMMTRRSVRRFSPQPVSRELLERILQAAIRAPSAHNRQPWRFAVLLTHEAKGQLAQAMGEDFLRDLLADGLSPQEAQAQVERSRRRILQAPVGIVVCYDPSDMDVYPDASRRQAERMMGIQSVAMAGQNLLLAAHAEGLGAVWVCAPLFAPDSVRRSLELPGEWEPQGVILMGYPAKIPDPRERRSVAQVSRFL
jgi:coenzyme F420-0:L-glutamate ligase/coenzyme F420-1:gamma-L-glutamate ligase